MTQRIFNYFIWGLLGFLACGTLACKSAPQVRYYHLPLHESIQPGEHAPADMVLAIDFFLADSAYDDQRLIYRSSAYAFDYDHYHRWASPPGQLLADYLRQAYLRTAHFAHVTTGHSLKSHAMLSGRITALEEVHHSSKQWSARIALELHLRDTLTGRLLWTASVVEEETMGSRSPEDFVRALNKALARVVHTTTPQILAAGMAAKK